MTEVISMDGRPVRLDVTDVADLMRRLRIRSMQRAPMVDPGQNVCVMDSPLDGLDGRVVDITEGRAFP